MDRRSKRMKSKCCSAEIILGATGSKKIKFVPICSKCYRELKESE